MQGIADRVLVRAVPSTEHWLGLVDSLMLDLLARTDSASLGSNIDIASDAATYHILLGGQKIRARLALSACANLGVCEQDAIALGACVELLHNASLIHDDLQDQDAFRRGAPAVWSKYGSDVAICAGDLLLSAAYAAIAQVNCTSLLPALLLTTHTKVSRAVKGQCADLSFHAEHTNQLTAYHAIAINKSGALLSLPLELALIAGNQSAWVAKARQSANDFAIAYQIFDDIQDIEKDSAINGTQNANILTLLQSQQNDHHPLQTAIDLGIKKLEESAAMSASLPKASGTLLTDLAKKLQLQFKLISV